MHSRIIALNGITYEDELLDMMPHGVDYVHEMERLGDAGVFLRRLGTVKNEMLTPELDKVEKVLDEMYHEYLKYEIKCFADFTDDSNVWGARNALDNELGLYIYLDGWGLMTWAEFLRYLYKNLHRGEVFQWKITGCFDYHF